MAVVSNARHALDCGLCCGLAHCDCGVEKAPMYRVLRPKYEKTGETTQTTEGVIHWQRVREFEVIGLAKDMDEANRLYPRGYWNGFSHVLERITT